MKKRKIIFLFTLISSFNAVAATNDLSTNTTKYTVNVGVSRLVYNLDSNGSIFWVSNKQDYPMLVRSRILTEDHKIDKDFIVTPPLFRLSPKAENALQVVRIGGSFPNNKESLAWLCVKGIPPKEDDLWSSEKDKKSADKKSVILNINMSIETCVKMFIRPKSLSGTSTDYAANVKWKVEDGGLIAYNNSPFFINLTNVKLDGKKITPNYIPPMSHKKIETKSKVTNGMTVSWQAINDYGGDTKSFSTKVN
ncbi:molecular chaperone [Salmonella enterica]|uniref:fimbrial biogenesis chaperone n=1 Tax=Salmonella enterica TaxID=28901 RepID=UPI0002BA7D09|nr:molecular chaperone [Salmonella enterica]